MVQIVSTKQFTMQSFAFQRGVTFDHHASKTQAVTWTATELPGLEGSYSFASTVAMWNGTAAIATADSLVSYTGTGLKANSAGTPNAGTVTGLFNETGNLGSYLVGASISGADVFAASQTNAREDDMAILRDVMSGNDRVTLSAFADVLAAQDGDDVVRAGAGADSIYGNAGKDTLFGENGDDFLSGGFGYDRISGGRGRDEMHGGDGTDRMFGNQDADRIYGEAGQDRLFGGYGYDVLYGGVGRDVLQGDRGADVLFGGNDTDQDRFVFVSTADSPDVTQRDVVYDFVSGTDLLDLSAIDADNAATGDQAFTFSGTQATAHGVWYGRTGTSVIVSADVSGDGVADISIRVTDISTLSASDFVF